MREIQAIWLRLVKPVDKAESLCDLKNWSAI